MTAFPRPEYATLRRYVPERGRVALDLSDNTNLWGTHPAALARIRAAATDDLARYPQPYADVLRDAVSERFGVDRDCVTTGAGSDDVLDSTFRAAAAPGAVVRYAAPTFSMVETLARMNGLETEAVPWTDALADPARLLECPTAALVYVCRPNNPTGASTPTEWIERLLGLAGERGASAPLVVVDEAYADFAGATLVARAPAHPRLVVARTTSKAYGLAGLRCGYAVARKEVALEIEKSRGPYKVSRLAAEASAAALRDTSGWMEETVAASRESRTRLWTELERRGLAPLESDANFVLFAAPTGSASADADQMRSTGVAVRPFADVPEVGDALRVTVGPWRTMETFLDALDRLRASARSAGNRPAGSAKRSAPAAETS